jgi:hypothetical protein
MRNIKDTIIKLKALAKVANPETNPVTAEEFATAIAMAAPKKKGKFKVSDFLTPYNAEEYSNMETFLNKDKTAGYALKRILDEAGNPTDNKELVSVFNVGNKPGIGSRLAAESAMRGATSLDNYSVDNVLPKLYGKAGFVETERYPFAPEFAAPGTTDELIKAAPDYVMMKIDQKVANELLKTRFLTPDEFLNYIKTGSIPYYKYRALQNAGVLGSVAGAGGLIATNIDE